MYVLHRIVIGLFAIFAFIYPSFSYGENVAFAGVSYAGQYATIKNRFPYTFKIDNDGQINGNKLTKKVALDLKINPPQNFKIIEAYETLKGLDKAIALTLLFNNEVTSVEKFSSGYKVFTQLRAQALFFDLVSSTIIRSYPLSFAYITLYDHPPTREEIENCYKHTLFGTGSGPSLLYKFSEIVDTASLPQPGTKFIKILDVSMSTEAKSILAGTSNEPLNSVDEKTWIADTFTESLSNNTGAPILPYAIDYAEGKVIPLTVNDGTIYNLKLPDPDYQILVNLIGLKKVKFAESPAGTSYIYGAFISVEIKEPVSGHIYLNSLFKNGVVKVVPVTQDTVDEYHAYADAISGLFEKLSAAIAGKNTDWLTKASSENNIKDQILSTSELFQSCK